MWEWWKAHWRNGLRFQIAMSILIFGGVIALYLQFYNFAHEEDPPVLGLVIDNLSVAPRVEVGGELVYSRTICNQSAESLAGTVQRRLIDDRATDNEVLLSTISVELPPGECEAQPSQPRMIAVPEDISPGLWRLRLILITTPRGGFISQEAATSEPFEVIEGAGE